MRTAPMIVRAFAPLVLLAALALLPRLALAAWPAGGMLLPDVGRYEEIGPDGQGGVFVVRVDGEAPAQSIRVFHFDAAGEVAAGWPVAGVVAATPTKNPGFFAVTPDAAGGTLLAWTEPDTAWQGYAQRVTAAGAIALGWPARGARVSNANFELPMVATDDGTGGLVCAWVGPHAGQRGVRVQHLLGDGTRAAGFATDGLSLTATLLGRVDYKGPTLVRDPAGGFWLSYVVVGTDSVFAPSEVRVARLLPSGKPDLDQETGGVVLPIPHDFAQSWSGPSSPVAVAPDGAGGALAASFAGDGLRAFRLLETPELDPEWPADGVLLEPGALGLNPIYWPLANVPLALPDAEGGAYFAYVDPANEYRARGIRVGADGAVAPGWEGGRLLGGVMAQDLVGVAGGVFASGLLPASCPHYSCVGAGTLCVFLPDGAVAPGWPAANAQLGGLPGQVLGGGYLGDNAKLCPDDAGGVYALWRARFGDAITLLGRFGTSGFTLAAPPALASGLRARFVPGAGVRVACALPGAAAVTLELYDVHGRRLARERLAGGGGEVTLAGTHALPAGLWFVRATAGPRFVVAKVAVTR